MSGSDAKHTPGPWTIGNANYSDPENPKRLRIEGTEIAFGNEWKRDICKTLAHPDILVEQANAALIAAAPELLLCLERIRDKISEWGRNGGKFSAQTLDAIDEIAEHAIARAVPRG